MNKQLKPWHVKIDEDEVLKENEEFKGIHKLTDAHGKEVIVGLIETWDIASQVSGIRYCNIKFYQK